LFIGDLQLPIILYRGIISLQLALPWFNPNFWKYLNNL